MSKILSHCCLTMKAGETIMLDQSTIANLATLQIAGLEKP